MRIIYESSLAGYKITTFANGMRYSCKIESPILEMIYKFPEHTKFSDNVTVINFVKSVFESLISQEISQVERNIFPTLKHFLNSPSDEEEII